MTAHPAPNALPHLQYHVMVSDFRQRFFIALIVTIPILLLSPIIQSLIGIAEVFRFPASDYLLWALSTVVYLYCSRPFLVGMAHEVRAFRPNRMTLIGLAVSAIYVYSSLIIFELAPGMHLFAELVSLIDILLLGHWLESKIISNAHNAQYAHGNIVENIPSGIHHYANRAAFFLTLAAIMASIATLYYWLMIGNQDFAFALEKAVTVLLIACPHAFVLAVPLVVTISSAILASDGTNEQTKPDINGDDGSDSDDAISRDLTRAAIRKIKQNLLWACVYNLVALPLAAGVFYEQGIIISPAIAAILMSVSTIAVAANAQRLSRFQIAE